MIKILLLGSEGCAEAEYCSFVRKATPDESKEFFAQHPDASVVDRTRRPYWLVAIDLDHHDCPPELKERLASVVRTVRLD